MVFLEISRNEYFPRLAGTRKAGRRGAQGGAENAKSRRGVLERTWKFLESVRQEEWEETVEIVFSQKVRRGRVVAFGHRNAQGNASFISKLKK